MILFVIREWLTTSSPGYYYFLMLLFLRGLISQNETKGREKEKGSSFSLKSIQKTAWAELTGLVSFGEKCSPPK